MPIQNTKAEELGRALGGNRLKNGSWSVLGPGHRSRDRSLVLTDTPRGVVWQSFAGDGDAECMEHLLAAVGKASAALARGAPEQLSVADEAKIERDVAAAKAIWDEGQPILPGTPAATYLASRGIFPPYRSDLRWHPAVPFGPDAYGAMIACVRNAYSGMQTGLHSTFLTPDGQKRRVGGTERAFGGKAAGGGLWPESHDDTLILAEGIETALSAEAQFGIPAVAALSRAGLAALYIPSSVRRVYLVADNDAKADGVDIGLEKIRAIASDLAGRGIDVLVFYPTTTEWDANSITKHRMAEGSLHPIAVEVSRKTAPVRDAIAYGQGRLEIGLAALRHPYLHEAGLKDKDGRPVSRSLMYLEMCAASAHQDQIVTLDVGGREVEIIVPAGCSISSQRFLADGWNISRAAARNFTAQAAHHGLMAIRRPMQVNGALAPNDVPDLVEFSVRFTPNIVQNNSSCADLPVRPILSSSAQGFKASSAQGVYVENIALSLCYEVYHISPAPRVSEAPAPKYLSADAREKTRHGLAGEAPLGAGADGSLNSPSGSVVGNNEPALVDIGEVPSLTTVAPSTRGKLVRVPLIDTFVEQRVYRVPLAIEMPWYVVPDALGSQRRTKQLPPAIDPVADLADGILPDAPPGTKTFGNKIQFKPRTRGGRPAKGRA